MANWFDSGSGSPVDAPALLDSKAGELIGQMLDAGALVSIGKTSDGGALGVTVTVDGEWKREYFRESETLVEWLTGGLGPVQDACETARAARASSGSRGRRRRP